MFGRFRPNMCVLCPVANDILNGYSLSESRGLRHKESSVGENISSQMSVLPAHCIYLSNG